MVRYRHTAAEAAAPLHQGRKPPSWDKSMWIGVGSPAAHLPDDVLPPCTRRPQDWFPDTAAELASVPATQAVSHCQVCPLRRGCARIALDDATRVYGIWAGVYLPLVSAPGHKAQRRAGLAALRAVAGYSRR